MAQLEDFALRNTTESWSKPRDSEVGKVLLGILVMIYPPRHRFFGISVYFLQQTPTNRKTKSPIGPGPGQAGGRMYGGVVSIAVVCMLVCKAERV